MKEWRRKILTKLSVLIAFGILIFSSVLGYPDQNYAENHQISAVFQNTIQDQNPITTTTKIDRPIKHGCR